MQNMQINFIFLLFIIVYLFIENAVFFLVDLFLSIFFAQFFVSFYLEFI